MPVHREVGLGVGTWKAAAGVLTGLGCIPESPRRVKRAREAESSRRDKRANRPEGKRPEGRMEGDRGTDP